MKLAFPVFSPHGAHQIPSTRFGASSIDEQLDEFQQKMFQTLGQPLPISSSNEMFQLHPYQTVDQLRRELVKLSRLKTAQLIQDEGPHPKLDEMQKLLKKTPKKINYYELLNRIVDFELDTNETETLRRSGKTKLFHLWRWMASISFDGVEYNQPLLAIRRNRLLTRPKK